MQVNTTKTNSIYNGRKSRLLRLVGLLLVTVTLSGVLLQSFPLRREVFAEDKITEEDIDDLQQMVDALEKKKEEQEDLLAQMEKDEVRLQAALASYGSLATLYYEQIAEVEEHIVECQARLDAYKLEIADLEAERAELYDDFKLTLRALRESKNVTVLELIFNAESLTDLLSAVERAKDLSRYKKMLLDRMEDNFSEIHEKKGAMEKELAEQISLSEKLDAMKTEVEEQIASTEDYLTATAQKILETENALSELTETSEEYEKELTDLIRRYEEQLEKERRARQTLLWPLDMKNKRVTSPYGYRYHPISGKYKFHTGIDLAGPTSGVIKQNNIYASMDGVVITCVDAPYSKTGYGSYVIISHGYSERYGGNISTLYAHCDSLNVVNGQEVKQGQLIAKVGTTGSSTGYHLHYEVRMNGLTTDPLSYEYITVIDGTPVNPKSFVTGSF